jgi:tape measure domain-containing protein
VRDGFGKFVPAAQLAAEAAGNVGGSLGNLSDVAGRVNTSLNQGLVAGFAKFDAALKPLEAGLGRLGQGLQDVGGSLTASVTLPLGLLGAASLKSAGDIQALEKGFAATYEGSEQLGAALAKVQELAKLPGLGLEEALQGATNLQAAGFSADLARRSLGAFGNALATVGKGKADLDGVGLALGQIASKGKISAEEINQLAERVPQIRKAMQAAFGTADTAVLQKLSISATDFVEGVTAELEKLPKVTGGINNAFENLADAGTISLSKLGGALNQAFDIESTLGGLADAVTGAATSFEQLDPSTQKIVFALAAAAAATGPLLFGIGKVIVTLAEFKAAAAALNLSTSGLGAGLVSFATGPVGIALAALAALAAGVYYVATANERALSSYRDVAKEADRLTATTEPLLARYQELTEKTALTETEQRELTSVIEQLAAAVPGAITQIDRYGKVTGISAERVTALTQALQGQKAANAALNLPAAQVKLEQLKKTYDNLQKSVDQFNKTGAVTQAGPSLGPGGGAVVATYKASSEAVAELRAELANANVAYQQQAQLVQELTRNSGALTSQLTTKLTPALSETDLALKFLGGQGESASGLLAGLHLQLQQLQKDQQDAPTEKLALAYNPLIDNLEKYIARLEGSDTASKKSADALANLQKELLNNANASRALGADYDYSGGKAKILESGIKSLTDAGFAPGGKVVQDYVRQLREVPKAIEQIQGRTVKGLDLSIPDFELKLPNLEGVPDMLAMDLSRIPVDAEGISEAYDKAVKAQEAGSQKLTDAQINSLDRQRAFNTQFEELVDNLSNSIGPLIADFAGQFGEALGSIVTGSASASDALAVLFGGIVAALGDFMTTFGKQLVTIGIGKLALDSLFTGPQGGPLAIAAGLGLIALGSVVSAVGKSAAASLSSIGSGGAGASLASQPRSNTGSTSTANQQPIKIVAEFKLRGSDLVAVGRVGAYRELRTN